MTLELYHGLASTCSKKVRLCLFEKGLAFTSRVVNLQKFEQHDPAYLKLNPNGVVPTLVHDGKPVIESSRIIEYLDDVFPDPPLRPVERVARQRMTKWIDWSDAAGYQAVYVATWNALSRPVAQRLTDAALNETLGRVPTVERKERWRAVARQGFATAEIEAGRDCMTVTLAELEHDLAGGPWIAGDVLSLGDIAILPFVERIFDLEPQRHDPSAIPRLVEWFAALKARPSFDKAFFFDGIDTRVGAIRRQLAAEGLISEGEG